MAVVAHTVGPDTMGEIPQLELNTTFADTAWRAMIIKDNEGDWGVCVAAWKGVKKGVPGVKGTANKRGTPGVPGHPGYFLMIYLNLRTMQTQRVRLNSTSHTQFVDLDELQVDWNKGNILVRKSCANGHIAQNICLTFVTSTLYLLVQPRPEDVEQAEQAWVRHKTFASQQSLITPSFVRNAAIILLLYSGWREYKKLPSNSSVFYESRRQDKYPDDNNQAWPYYFWAAGYWGALDHHCHDGVYDMDGFVNDAGLSDAFVDAADGGVDMFSGCAGCGGGGGGDVAGGGCSFFYEINLKTI